MPATYNPDVTQVRAPAAVPTLGVAPPIAMPLDGEALNVLSIDQALKAQVDAAQLHYDEVMWRTRCQYREDFVYTPGALPASNAWTTRTGLHDIGQTDLKCGLYKMTSTQELSTNIGNHPATCIGTRDFRFRAGVYFSGATGTTDARIGFENSPTTHGLMFVTNGVTDWRPRINTVNQAPSAVVAPSNASTAEQVLEIKRVAGVVTFKVNNTQIYSAAYATSIAAWPFILRHNAGAGTFVVDWLEVCIKDN